MPRGQITDDERALAEAAMTKARSSLIMNHPFYGVLALKLKLIDHDDTPTASVDGAHLRYNSRFINKLSAAQVKGLVAHEVMHCVFSHMTRREQREPARWNIAADHAINLLLLDDNFILPDEGIHDPQYKNMSTEAIYANLPADAGPQCVWGMVTDAGAGDSDDDNDSGNPVDVQEIETDWLITMKQAAEIAKQAGKMPAGIERLMDSVERGQIDFRDHLWPFFQAANNDDYNWKRPHRAYISEDEYFPSLHSEAPGVYVVAIDTSGSTQDQLQKFLAEICSIHADMRPEKLILIHCDASVQKVVTLDPDETMTLEEHGTMVGGGGTRFEPVFQYIDEHNIDPECVVYLTDGECEWPTDVPHYPVLWVITNKNMKAEWGNSTYLT